MRVLPLGDQAALAYCDDEAHATALTAHVRREEPRRRRRFWSRERPAAEEGEAEQDEDRPKHVRVLPAEVEGHAEPLDPWEEELDAEPEPEAEHEPTPRG